MPFPDRRTVNVLLTVLLFAAVLAVAYIARAVLVIFCFSILFAYLIDPMVRFVQRHSLFFRNLRGPHVAESYLALLIVVALLVYTLAPGLLSQTGKLLRELPAWGDYVHGNCCFWLKVCRRFWQELRRCYTWWMRPSRPVG